MASKISDNSRIAKNTLLLYLRQLLVLVVSLYTSRVVLATLGVSDYGIYNVVGSVVTMFVFIRSAMGNATNRYIAFALGKGNKDDLKRIFSTCLHVHVILAIIIVVLSESVGLWLLYNKLEIPADRMVASFWVMQFSIVTCAVGVLCVPYDAEIIAHEKMSIYTVISILDVFLKLGAVFLLRLFGFDKLILYAFFLLCIQLMDRIIYSIYCKRNFPETRHATIRDKVLVKEMFGFAGWNLLGNMAAIANTPILNVLLNMFFGPVVNAARGIAVQVQGAVKSFIQNFQLAVIPQITKNYAADNLQRMHTLIISCSKLSYFLFLCMALPICLETKYILSLWLVEVPDHTASFLRLVFCVMLIESWEQPLHTANLATGKIKKFQTIKGVSLLMVLPISYIALRKGASAEGVFIIQFIVTLVSLLIQLFMIRPLIRLSLRRYFSEVFFRSFVVTIIASIIPFLLFLWLPESFLSFLVVVLTSVLLVMIVAFFIGMNKVEKQFFIEKIGVFFAKKGNKE